LLTELESRTLNLVCQQLSEWTRYIHESDFFASLSVSHYSFAKPDFAATVADSLRRYHLPTRHLALEIAETSLVQNYSLTANSLQELAAAGIQVVLADFGQEYSSLGRLMRLPHTGLKIDRTFTVGIHDPANFALIRQLVTLAHDLDRTVMAEGIQTSAQAATLNRLQCDFGQGDWFSRPVTTAQMEQLLLKPAVS
jgi:EAL domain-containing protein (putative c-di-GMP-specific phosphodiesterase class I)